ncbi:hypothetical protein EBB07_20135 [Paenibacillaceae bacterium]|nr:hypothetical protein EBB07_20135 [Paenibacillaceae bacterium]
MIKTILLVTLVALLAAAFEVPAQWKQGRIKEVIAYSLLLVAGSVLSVIAIQDIQIPSPMIVPETIYKPLYNWLNGD